VLSGTCATVRKYALLCLLCLSPFAQALELGRARVLSGAGQVLQIEVPIVQITAQEAADLRVGLAPLVAWQDARLTPPVPLSALQVQVVQGAADRPVIRVYATQIVTAAVADILLDVRTPSAQQRHHVSVPLGVLLDPPGAPIAVRWGDTLSALALTHAVRGFSAYQMMAALYYANPEAFIDQNMNLVKAGAVLRRPDAALLTSLTDRQARQLFVRHAQAHALRRARMRTSVDTAGMPQAGLADVVQGQVSGDVPAESAAQTRDAAPRDQLMLSSASSDSAAQGNGSTQSVQSADVRDDTRTAQRHAMQDTLGRINRLEDNISALQSALEASGTGSSGSPDAPVDTPNNTIGTLADVATTLPGSSAAQADAVLRSATATAPQAASPPVLSASLESDPAPATTASVWVSLLVALGALLGLVFWLLRRTRIVARKAAGGQITDAMIQEKLHSIDLNLDPETPRKV